MTSFRKVVIGISGGVDSAVSALLLKRRGYDVHGVFMKNWDAADEGTANCSYKADREDAAYVCKKLDIPFREVSFVKEYWTDVFTYMLEGYEKGLVPNPDIMCNRKIKFDMFFKMAMNDMGADAVATGHYARSSFGCYLENYKPGENARLLAAVDSKKDQSFFLSYIPQESLRRTMFPLGMMLKGNVKAIAFENGLERFAKKRESMGMCFIGKRDFQKFMSNYIVSRPGQFINIDTGKSLGPHPGFHKWILGQRLRIGGLREANYVVKKFENGDLVVAPGRLHPAGISQLLFLGEPYWIARSPPPALDVILDCEVRWCNTQPLVKCHVFRLRSNELCVLLEKPDININPGQFAVFYEGDECLGSARVNALGPSYLSLGKTAPENMQPWSSRAR